MCFGLFKLVFQTYHPFGSPSLISLQFVNALFELWYPDTVFQAEPNQAAEILEHLHLDVVLLLMYPKIAIALLADATGICNFYSFAVEDLK